jgi:tetratricopeptide (TPR) repeat protein
MSFEVVCSGCGATSGPSVGICPFCKTVMISSHDKNFLQESSVLKHYDNGRLDFALSLANKMYKDDGESKKDVLFLLLYAKILIDTEAPTSQVRTILSEAHLVDPAQVEVLDYIELMQAKMQLKKELNDAGEMMIKNIIRRSPDNIHAHFILGSHLFWTEGELRLAIPHLETCVRLKPNYLRAWGCLAAIYKKMGNKQLAQRAFIKCAELETESKMKAYFLEQSR